MRYLFFILISGLPASFVMAQGVPQGPSPLNIGVYEPETNTAVKAGADAAQGSPRGPSPLIIVTDEKQTNITVQTGIEAPEGSQDLMLKVSGGTAETAKPAVRSESSGTTNEVKSARISFLMNTGVQYADAGDYPEAERAYLRARDADPDNPNILFNLSSLYIQMGRYKDAIDILNGMAVKFPENALVHNNLAWAYSTGGAMKNGKLAVRHAIEAIMSDPIEASMWHTLAEAFYVSGQYDKALSACEYAVDLLKMQEASDEGIAEFEKQRTKILRAAEATKRLMNLDDKK